MPTSRTLRLGAADEAAVPEDPKRCTRPFHDWNDARTRFRDEANNAWRPVSPVAGNRVAELQRDLRQLGFNPAGPIDGIFGYRTRSAVRLFQEYVRAVDGDAGVGIADGIAGRKTFDRISQWKAENRTADWTPADDLQAQIFAGLEQLRRHFLEEPADPATAALQRHAGPTATRQVQDWSFDPGEIHLIGIRRADTELKLQNGNFVRRNDDVFVLLVNGVRFVFRGSTDPSPTMADRDDAAFLIRGQHEYRFGWHKLSSIGTSTVKAYRAFKPKGDAGVLVVRAENGQLTANSYARPAEPNPTINIHWSGAGTSNWSAGCQVIAGKRYKNFRGGVIDLSETASPGYADLSSKTRGAYNVLVDLVTVFAGDIRCASSDIVHYTLLYESDLANVPGSAGIDFAALIEDLT